MSPAPTRSDGRTLCLGIIAVFSACHHGPTRTDGPHTIHPAPIPPAIPVCDPAVNPALAELHPIFEGSDPARDSVLVDRTLGNGLRLRITRKDGEARAVLSRADATWLVAASAGIAIDDELRAASGARLTDTEGDGEPDGVVAEVPIVDRDITGDGTPDLVLRSWSGGAHCCHVLHVVSLGPKPCLLDTLGADHVGYLTDFDGDGVLEFVNHDGAWHHFGNRYTWMLEPELVHRYERGQWRLSPEFMKKAAPTVEETQSWVKAVADEKFDGTDCDSEACVLRAMLRLHYTGHPVLAWHYFARITDEIDKPRFKAEFVHILSQSDAWSLLRW
jgi:hypothetical protein